VVGVGCLVLNHLLNGVDVVVEKEEDGVVAQLSCSGKTLRKILETTITNKYNNTLVGDGSFDSQCSTTSPSNGQQSVIREPSITSNGDIVDGVQVQDGDIHSKDSVVVEDVCPSEVVDETVVGNGDGGVQQGGNRGLGIGEMHGRCNVGSVLVVGSNKGIVQLLQVVSQLNSRVDNSVSSDDSTLASSDLSLSIGSKLANLSGFNISIVGSDFEQEVDLGSVGNVGDVLGVGLRENTLGIGSDKEGDIEGVDELLKEVLESVLSELSSSKDSGEGGVLKSSNSGLNSIRGTNKVGNKSRNCGRVDRSSGLIDELGPHVSKATNVNWAFPGESSQDGRINLLGSSLGILDELRCNGEFTEDVLLSGQVISDVVSDNSEAVENLPRAKRGSSRNEDHGNIVNVGSNKTGESSVATSRVGNRDNTRSLFGVSTSISPSGIGSFQFIVVANSGKVSIGFHSVQEQIRIVSSNSKDCSRSNFYKTSSKIRGHRNLCGIKARQSQQ